MITGGYTLDLYCDNYDGGNLGAHRYNEFPHQITHELGNVCRAQARRLGWKVNYTTGEALCPKCVAAGVTQANAARVTTA